jgi:hypothetical protein
MIITFFFFSFPSFLFASPADRPTPMIDRIEAISLLPAIKSKENESSL